MYLYYKENLYCVTLWDCCEGILESSSSIWTKELCSCLICLDIYRIPAACPRDALCSLMWQQGSNAVSGWEGQATQNPPSQPAGLAHQVGQAQPSSSHSTWQMVLEEKSSSNKHYGHAEHQLAFWRMPWTFAQRDMSTPYHSLLSSLTRIYCSGRHEINSLEREYSAPWLRRNELATTLRNTLGLWLELWLVWSLGICPTQ